MGIVVLSCHSCGRGFVPQSLAWRDEMCGDCIAGRIEQMLTESTRTRRPMRRATDGHELTQVSDESVESKAA